jgi:predicted nucleic acid-binding protein
LVVSGGEWWAICWACSSVPYSRNPDATQRAIRTFLRGVRILPLTRQVIERFATLKARLAHRGQLIGDFDTLIAATALHHGLTLVTRNRRHFELVPELPLHVPS